MSSLPDDLLLSIFARISRLYYPTLSLVSKSFRSLLASPDLYKARSLLGHTESCLYVCFHFDSGPNTHWFTLCRKPDGTLTNDTSKKKKSNGYVLATVPIPHSPPANFSSLVAVGSDIYNIGGSIYLGPSSSSVSILDCQSHMWREAPSLRVELMSHSASVLDRKIYVAGSYKDGNGDSNSCKNLFEVFDTKTQVWHPEPIPCSKTKGFFYSKRACIDGKFHVETTHGVVYAYKEGRWDKAIPTMFGMRASYSFCEINNVLFYIHRGVFRWYDTKLRMWRILKGLLGLPSLPENMFVRLADYGGKMAVLWEEDRPSCGAGGRDEMMIWCAVIALKRHLNFSFWGKVEWFDHVLTVPKQHVFVKALTASL
ncbi:F-box domain [Arabidopsis suecica]|uniref:F-box domain n=1 Tax=Arabidopsis suecica TaxID=45249 RepID=A0A8T2DMA2_ARASU|nr:F-box domain [Arabidopsis suecica]